MSKRTTIREIAEMAGVSPGTVYKILHNKGNVSNRSKAAVDKVLAATGYVSDEYFSATAKSCRLAVLAPAFSIGDYWSRIYEGIREAVKQSGYPGVSVDYFFYNQFDIYSCLAAHRLLLEKKPDAVIIGPTFLEETVSLCASLDELSIPYALVDSILEGAHPLAIYATDQFSAGRVMAHLLTAVTKPGSKLAVFESKRSGARFSMNSMVRRDGFVDFLKSAGREKDLIEPCYTSTVPSENEEVICHLLEQNKNLEGIAVLNARGSSIAEVLNNLGRADVKLISFDMTMQNVEFLRKGSIFALLCQHPYWQGFEAASTLIRHQLQGKEPATALNLLSIDIVLKEIVDFYKDNGS